MVIQILLINGCITSCSFSEVKATCFCINFEIEYLCLLDILPLRIKIIDKFNILNYRYKNQFTIGNMPYIKIVLCIWYFLPDTFHCLTIAIEF